MPPQAVAAPAAWDLAARLEHAALLLHDDPDAAALVLEGALHQLIVRWYARRELRLPAPERLLADLAAHDELLALRLRLALRAPDVAARLAHLRVLLPACDDEPLTLGPSLSTGRGVVHRQGEDGRDARPGKRVGYRPHAARLVLDSPGVPARVSPSPAERPHSK